ncbi:PREDICTED: ankyrin repeat and SOCS box protein 10 [Ficedula albicollis]|uniref:ankyrin repeat and SOCS box protein 10 n=1 Tax=Ficedula albicollis TaxID=59894 RepID=UPI0007AD8D8F|nr:PREDICTED: ankyrin repeat and SOCS box protein 10 [Ficedula albicollis]
MDCTFPLRSATQRSLQPARWKNAHGVGSHHSEHSLSPGGSGHQHSRLEPLECRDLLVQNALFTGDLDMVQKYFTKGSAINLIIETRGDVLRWTSSKRGLWSLSYEQELTTPLHITASRGHTGCLRLLLQRGAAPDLAPGGRTALHAGGGAARAACARLLLRAGADPEALSEDGYRPLHLCRSADSIECVRQLLQYGASVNSQTEEENDTALHVASRLGLVEHVQLLLHHGAELEVKNKEGQTPLNAACAQHHQPQDMDRYYRVCQLLVESGASINAADREQQRPLHLACKNANAQIAELLLARGANVNVMNYGGSTALHNILQVAAYKLEHHPELVVRALLNHGAVRVWPGSLLKVLQSCHSCPRAIEALVNSYSHVRVSEDWEAAVPAEVVQKYPCFYQSLFSLGHSPRSLQHLARCALRTLLEGRLQLVLSQLHLPRALHQFLLLGFEDVLY